MVLTRFFKSDFNENFIIIYIHDTYIVCINDILDLSTINIDNIMIKSIIIDSLIIRSI